MAGALELDDLLCLCQPKPFYDRRHLLRTGIFKQTVTGNLHAKILKQLANPCADMIHSRAKERKSVSQNM